MAYLPKNVAQTCFLNRSRFQKIYWNYQKQFFFFFRSIPNIQKITETIILQTKYSFDASSLDNKRDELLSDGNFLTEIKSERRNSITSSSLNRLERRNSGSWSSTNYSSNAHLDTVYNVSSITKNTTTFRSAVIVLANVLCV